jgi:hypothetical protein
VTVPKDRIDSFVSPVSTEGKYNSVVSKPLQMQGSTEIMTTQNSVRRLGRFCLPRGPAIETLVIILTSSVANIVPLVVASSKAVGDFAIIRQLDGVICLKVSRDSGVELPTGPRTHQSTLCCRCSVQLRDFNTVLDTTPCSQL